MLDNRNYTITLVDEEGGTSHPQTRVRVRHDDGREISFWLEGWGVDAGTIHETAERMLGDAIHEV